MCSAFGTGTGSDKMESVTVVAGSGQGVSVDGVGTDAGFVAPKTIAYSEATDTCLIAESEKIRRLFPATEKRKSALKQSITSALCDAVPVKPLISLVFDYAITNSTSSADMSCVVLAR